MKKYINLKLRNKKQYTYPKLCTCKGDLTKSWYVYFVFTPEEGEKKQFRYKFGINSLKTKKEREKEGAVIASLLWNRLEDGWNPITDQVEEDPVNILLIDALDEILQIKKAYITPRSYKTYYDQISLFKKWLVLKKYDKLYAHNFTRIQAQQYFDWLLVDKKYCGKTYNGLLGVLRSFFTAIEERYPNVPTPITGFKMLPQDVGKNTTYSEDEEKKLEQYMKANEKYFYYATRFVKYCFFRRSELAKIQVKHIKWDNKTIVVPSESAKSRVQDSVTISKTLEKIIVSMGILDLDPNTYIFGHPGKKFKPSLVKMKRVDDFSDKQRALNKALEIKQECSFYSWKHTGVVELYNIVKDPYIVMRQCRHSDIKMTMIYLRSLGCGVNEQVREW